MPYCIVSTEPCVIDSQDQEQTPEHPGGGHPYPVDGDCIEQCDCGGVNPCAEYIFNHSGAEIEGQSFRDWFINSYMISNETLFHKNPATGAPQVIGLGWLDDSMSLSGPSEEDKNYIVDTGASAASMMAQTAAYRETIWQLTKKVLPMGGFWWQLMDSRGVKVNPTGGWNSGQNQSVPPPACKAALDAVCVGANACRVQGRDSGRLRYLRRDTSGPRPLTSRAVEWRNCPREHHRQVSDAVLSSCEPESYSGISCSLAHFIRIDT